MLYRKVFSFYVALLQVKGIIISCACVILHKFGHVACIKHNANVGALIYAIIRSEERRVGKECAP